MRRLTLRGLRARAQDERGAVGVMVALLLVPLLAVAAIAVDVSALYSDRQQLRNAADAAALAIAADCARGACGNGVATATAGLDGNTGAARTADATVRTPQVSVSGRTVTVTTSADQAHWFAPVLGQDSSRVTATSTAVWAPTTLGRADFPLIISYCEWKGQVDRRPLNTPDGPPMRINATTRLGDTCIGPSGPTLSGYAVTAPDDARVCRTTGSLGSWVRQFSSMFSDRLPATCSASYLGSLIGSTILIPVWDQVRGTYPNVEARIYGYSAFYITGYDVWASDPALLGYFTYGAQISDATTTSTTPAPDLGARSVLLTEQR